MSNEGTPEGVLLVISAPSGAGKTSLASELQKQVEGLRFSVSHTTREARPGEEHGVDYFFVSNERFEAMIRQGDFLEYARVYDNYYYGTSREFVESHLAAGHDVLLDIDVQGAMQVRAEMKDALLVFVFPPSFQELEKRLRKRRLDRDDEIDRRLATAAREITRYSKYDYLIVNDDLAKSVDELKSVLLAARCSVSRRRRVAEDICSTFAEGAAAAEKAD